MTQPPTPECTCSRVGSFDTNLPHRHYPAALPPDSDSRQFHVPTRGSDVETWIQRYRDLYIDPSTGERTGVWHAIDDMLDDYREHADTGVPLSGQVVGPHEEF